MLDNTQIKIKRESDNTTFGIGKGYDWKLLKSGLSGFGSFDNTINYVDNGLHDGGIITSTRMTKVDRTIACGYILPSNNEVVRRTVTAFFNAKDTYKVYITYMGRTLWAEGKLSKLELSTNEKKDALMKLQMTFTFPSPYLKSYDDFGENIASKTPKMGFPYLCSTAVNPAGLTAGVYNFDKEVQLLNDGDVDTYCKAIFKANGEVVNPSLVIDDQYVKVLDTMEEGDEIIMDFTKFPPTVTKNGVNYIGHCDRTSAFANMLIKVGDATVKFAADDGENNLAVTFYYNKLYTLI